jgi:hypothetical protein
MSNYEFIKSIFKVELGVIFPFSVFNWKNALSL